MAWRFWKAGKSEAQVSLEELQAGMSRRTAANTAAARDLRNAAATNATRAARPDPSGPRGPFRLTIEDVFSITGRGTVVTGRVEAGTVSVGMIVSIATAHGPMTTTVAGVEVFRSVRESASTGENVGLLLRGVAKVDLGAGDVVTG